MTRERSKSDGRAEIIRAKAALEGLQEKQPQSVAVGKSKSNPFILYNSFILKLISQSKRSAIVRAKWLPSINRLAVGWWEVNQMMVARLEVRATYRRPLHLLGAFPFKYFYYTLSGKFCIFLFRILMLIFVSGLKRIWRKNYTKWWHMGVLGN